MTTETDSVLRSQMWLVVSVGGQATTGDPMAQWFAQYGEAWYEMRRRLGVERLHRKKHNKHQRFTFGPHEIKRHYRGLEWRPESAEDYQAETMRRAPFVGSGGSELALIPSCRRDKYPDLPANLQMEPRADRPCHHVAAARGSFETLRPPTLS